LTEKKITVFIGIVTSIIALLAIVYNDLRVWLFPPRVVTCGELIASRNFIGTNGNKTYIPQPSLEAVLSLFIGRAGEEYIVVNGPKGAGKSTVVNRVISNQSFGVMSLSLQSSDTDVYTIIANDICGQKGVWKINDAALVFQESIQIVRKRTGLVDWVPTLAIEVDRASSDVSVHQIARDVKLLCVDKGVCRGIIVLSDALAAFALPKDPRVELLWVDDFSINQANLYFDSLGYLKSDDTSACKSAAKNCTWNNLKMRSIFMMNLAVGPLI